MRREERGLPDEWKEGADQAGPWDQPQDLGLYPMRTGKPLGDFKQKQLGFENTSLPTMWRRGKCGTETSYKTDASLRQGQKKHSPSGPLHLLFIGLRTVSL